MNNEHLINEIFSDVIDLLYDNHSEALIGDHYEDYYRPELMEEIIALRDKYKAECNKVDLKKVLVPYDNDDECDEGVVTSVICNGRADVIPAGIPDCGDFGTEQKRITWRGMNNMNNKIKFIERGWECPKCGAVMAPHMNVCINCKGNSDYNLATTQSSLDKYFFILCEYRINNDNKEREEVNE